MVELHLIYSALYAAVAVLGLVVTVVAWEHRAARGAVPLAVFMLGITIWSGACAAMWNADTLRQQVFWLNVENLGVWMVPVGFLTAAFAIARMHRWLAPGRVALLSIVSFVIANTGWLNPGRLFDTAFVARPVGSFTLYESVPGLLYYAEVVWAYALVVTAFIIIFRVYLRSHGALRAQAGTMLVGGMMPFLFSLITELRIFPGGLDLAPLGFLITGPLWLSAILRGEMLEVLPLARNVLVEQMSEGVLVIDEEDLVVDANPAALAMLQASLTEALGKPAAAVLGGIDGAADVLCRGGRRSEVLSIGSDGEFRYIELQITPLDVAPDNPPARLVTLRDVTEERRVVERLELARTVFDTASEGIVVIAAGENQTIVDVNEAYCRLTGRLREDTLGQDVRRFLSQLHPPGLYEDMQHSLSTSGKWAGELWQTRADGTAFPSWQSLTLAKDGQSEVRHVVGIFSDITEIRDIQDKLRHSATHDSLTGLPNRSLLDEGLRHCLARARRADSGLAVLFIDLDNFKTINDTLGHCQGDALLTEVAGRIVAVLRESDEIGRVGGDEFAVILTDIENPAMVEITAQRILETLAAPARLGDRVLHVAASIGVALFPTDGIDATSLMQHADLAMYRAKALGRNRVHFFSEELRAGLDRRIVIEKELWGAAEEDRYFLLYQPQVDLSTGSITGAEALVRLRSKSGIVLLPTEFIPVAEESDLVLRLGDWVLRKACEELAHLHDISPDLVMSLNFSARQFRGIGVDSLRDALGTSAIDARCLQLEITETALLADPQEAAARLGDLREATGIRVALDDFGTGYSSLTHVSMFHADMIKIDRSFIGLLPDDREAQAIVLSTIALAKGLRTTVCAEGPETEEQVRFLRANGCDCAQGFYFSPPVRADELARLLRGRPFELPDVQMS